MKPNSYKEHPLFMGVCLLKNSRFFLIFLRLKKHFYIEICSYVLYISTLVFLTLNEVRFYKSFIA